MDTSHSKRDRPVVEVASQTTLSPPEPPLERPGDALQEAIKVVASTHCKPLRRGPTSTGWATCSLPERGFPTTGALPASRSIE